MWLPTYTEHQKKHHFFEWHALKSTASKLIIFEYRYQSYTPYEAYLRKKKNDCAKKEKMK